MSSEPSAPDSLVPAILRALTEKMIPWSRESGMTRVVVAQSSPRSLAQVRQSLPPGVSVSAKKRQSQQVTVKTSHLYGYSVVTVRWPKDRLQASRQPFICCVLEGTADIHVSDYLLHCQAGDFVFLPPGVPHPDGSCPHLEGSDAEQRTCDLVWFYPWGGGIVCNICHSQGARHWTLVPSEHCFVLSQQAVLYMNELMREATARKESYMEIGANLLEAFLAVLHREIVAGHFAQQGVAIAEMGPAPHQDTPIEQARQYILAHLHEPLTIDEVAGAVYMSRSQFTKHFRQAMGQSFVAFLTEQRMKAARTMLRETALSIGTVSRFTGLRIGQLGRLFRRHEGVSPGEYREREQRRIASD